MTAPTARVRRTGLFVVVPADALVGDFRRRHHAASVERELPPHVTVLFPFVPADDLAEPSFEDVGRHFAGLAPFEATLAAVGTFARHVWLAPEPRDRFVELITATGARFPDTPLYGGDGHDPVPHLTIAEIRKGETLDAVAAIARSELEPSLPFTFAVSHVSLYEEGADGKWNPLRRFELG